MTYWMTFLDSLDSPGGHILLLLALASLAITLGHMNLTDMAVGALLTILRTTQSNQARQQNGTTPQ